MPVACRLSRSAGCDCKHAYLVQSQKRRVQGALQCNLLLSVISLQCALHSEDCSCSQVAQIRIILEAIHDMRQQYGEDVPCMFMGDLNLTPDSALYTFIATGELDCSAHDPSNMSGQQESRSAPQSNSANRFLPHTSQVCLLLNHCLQRRSYENSTSFSRTASVELPGLQEHT